MDDTLRPTQVVKPPGTEVQPSGGTMTDENFNRPLPIAAGITDEMRRVVIEAFARGYTVRAIRQRIMREARYELSESQLLRLSMLYAEDIDRAREEIRQMVLTRGVIDKHERLLRLAELAETLEPAALGEGTQAVRDPKTGEQYFIQNTPDLKAANAYIHVLKQIQAEVEPLNIQVLLPQEDPWGNLLQRLQESASNRQIPRTADSTPDANADSTS